MINKIIKKFVVFLSFMMIFLPMFQIKNVYAQTETYTKGVVKGNDVSVRTGAGTNYGLVKSDTGGSIYLSSPESVEVLGSTNGWYKIKFLYSGFLYTGYINGSYLTTTTVTIDNNYKNSLITKGFPESYAKKLAILHALHPNWQFEVSKTGLNFSDVIQGEAYPVNKNLINSSNPTLRSTEDGAYINGVYTQYGTGWYAASKQTIAYFIDPRNFLDEGHVFMFELLSYNRDMHKVEVIQQILNSSFMQGAYAYNGTNWTFANTFMQAAATHNVSPVHLASRALQEQGKTGSVLSLGNGFNGNYIGYYNFFNIGASGNNDYDIIMNGLRYAYNKGWNSQYSSIVNGSSLMGNGYIKVGQDTLYYQKFNTINRNSLYSNQYMQNVKAVYSEAYSTYTGYYNSGLLESNYVFKIPVYENMPGVTTLSATENSDNTLKSLSVEGCNLNPSFISSATNYTCNVPINTKQVTVSAEKTSLYSTMNGDGVVILDNDKKEVKINVTAANGSVRTYTVTINRVASGKESPSDIISSLGYNNSNNIISGINVGEDVSNIITIVKNRFTLANITIKDKNDKEKTSGIIATGDKVTIKNNNVTTTFTAQITGDTNSDGQIDIADLLKVQKHIKKASKLTDVYYSSADINNDGTIDIGDLLKVQKHIKGVSKIEK